MIPESFHFLRPAWLAALVPVALLAWAATHAATRSSAWRRVVDAHLLRHLLLTDAGHARRWPVALGAIAGFAATVALAGPTWEKIPQPTFTTSAPTVVVLDMSPAMQADDLSPSRLDRARLELHDLLERTRGGQVGLVLYTDEPFVAAPLTDDGRLIEEMLPTLEGGLMPLRAPRPDRALAQAKALLDQAGTASGRVLLVTSGMGDHSDATIAAAREIAGSGRTLSVLGAGTDDGAPSRDARGRIERDASGAPVLAKLDRAGLEALAAAGGGRFSEIRADESDLEIVAPASAASAMHAASAGSSAQFDVWRDAGIWLVLIPLAVAPLLFRRGLLAALALAVLAAAPGRADASTWSDLWSRRDQQGEAALAAGDAAAAAALFEDPAWRAAATYQSGTYDDAAAKYASLGGIENRYNLGNALAKGGKLDDAVAQYDQVLKQDPQHADARFNRDLVQRLLDEQRQQQQDQQQQQQDQQQGGDGEQQQADASGGGGDDRQDQKDASADGARDQQQSAQNDPADDGRQAKAGAAPQQAQQDPATHDQSHDGSGSGEQDQQQAAAPENAPQDAGQEKDQQKDQRQASAQEAGADQERGEAAAAAHDAQQQQQQQQHAARAATGERSDDDVDHAPDAAAAERNEAAQQDDALAHELDQALADEASQNDDATQDDPAPHGTGSSSANKPMTEQEQAREQALRNIPDDPAGLLRAKIRRQYAEKRYSRQEVSPSW